MKSIESKDGIGSPTNNVKIEHDNDPQIYFLVATCIESLSDLFEQQYCLSAISSMVSLDSYLESFYEYMDITPKYSTFEQKTTELSQFSTNIRTQFDVFLMVYLALF